MTNHVIKNQKEKSQFDLCRKQQFICFNDMDEDTNIDNVHIILVKHEINDSVWLNEFHKNVDSRAKKYLWKQKVWVRYPQYLSSLLGQNVNKGYQMAKLQIFLCLNKSKHFLSSLTVRKKSKNITEGSLKE